MAGLYWRSKQGRFNSRSGVKAGSFSWEQGWDNEVLFFNIKMHRVYQFVVWIKGLNLSYFACQSDIVLIFNLILY